MVVPSFDTGTNAYTNTVVKVALGLDFQACSPAIILKHLICRSYK